MNEQTIANITGAITAVLPSVVSLIQALFKEQNPNLPQPTNQEVMAAFGTACLSSIAKDDDWLAQHPAKPTADQ